MWLQDWACNSVCQNGSCFNGIAGTALSVCFCRISGRIEAGLEISPFELIS